MFSRVSTLYLLIAVSNTVLSTKRTIASPYLYLLTSNSEDICLPLVTLAYISIFIILDNFTQFWGKPSLSISFIFPISK